MKTDRDGNFSPWVQPKYGFDMEGKKVTPEWGYMLLHPGVPIQKGDRVFDVYSGWMGPDNYCADHGECTKSDGRWTTWARKVEGIIPHRIGDRPTIQHKADRYDLLIDIIMKNEGEILLVLPQELLEFNLDLMIAHKKGLNPYTGEPTGLHTGPRRVKQA